MEKIHLDCNATKSYKEHKWKWKLLSRVWLCDPWTMEPMGVSRPGYWSGSPFPSPDLPNPGMEPTSPGMQVDSLPLGLQGTPRAQAFRSKDGGLSSGSSLNLCLRFLTCKMGLYIYFKEILGVTKGNKVKVLCKWSSVLKIMVILLVGMAKSQFENWENKKDGWELIDWDLRDISTNQ